MALEEPSYNVIEPDAEIFGNDASKVKAFAINLNGVVTDIILSDYTDRLLIVITQYQNIGTLISVTKGTIRNLNGSGDVYDVKTISGLDSLEYQLTARYLSEQINIPKPAIFAICIKDHQLPTLKTLSKALLQNKIW